MVFNNLNQSSKEENKPKWSKEERVLYAKVLEIFGGSTRNINKLGEYGEENMTYDKVKEEIIVLGLLKVVEQFKAKIFEFLPKYKDDKEKNEKEQSEALERLERATLKAHKGLEPSKNPKE